MPGRTGSTTLAALRALPDAAAGRLCHRLGREPRRGRRAEGGRGRLCRQDGRRGFLRPARQRLRPGPRTRRGCERDKTPAEERSARQQRTARGPAARGQPPRRQQPAAGLGLRPDAGRRRSTDRGRARRAGRTPSAGSTRSRQVHRRLYTSDECRGGRHGRLSRRAGRRAGGSLVDRQPRRARCRSTAEPIRLTTDRAVSLGVIVNELVTQRLQICLCARPAGEVRVGAARATARAVPAGGRGRRRRHGDRRRARARHRARQPADRRDGQEPAGAVEYDAGHRGVRATLRAALL